MKCIKCQEHTVDDLKADYVVYPALKLVYCRGCREKHRPKHIPDNQYAKYWLKFSEKFRRDTMKKLEDWFKKLLEATECDADLGDPYTCIDDVRSIVRQMEIAHLAGEIENGK